MVSLRSLPQKRVNFVNEDYAWLCLPRQREEPRDKLVGLAVPFVRQDRGSNVDECSARLLRERLCKHGLAAPWGAVQQYTLRRAQQRGRREQMGIEQWVDN